MVRTFAARQNETQRIAERVNRQVNLSGKTAATSA